MLMSCHVVVLCLLMRDAISIFQIAFSFCVFPEGFEIEIILFLLQWSRFQSV